MSEYDRHFSRRNVIWKLTDVTRESIEASKKTPQFSIVFGDEKTKWYIEACVVRQHLGLFLHKVLATRSDFSVKFNAAVMKTGPVPLEYFGEKFEKPVDGFGGNITTKFIALDDLFNEDNQLLVGNELTLSMQVELMENSKVKMLEKNFLSNNYEKLFNNEKGSDFVFISCDGEKIYVQKSIAGAQCEAFATMIAAGLSETDTNSATIADVDSETMLELVRFLYIGRVENMQHVQERLVIAANKYGLKELKNLCVSSLMESLTFANADIVYEIGDLLSEDHLKKNCVDFIKCYRSRSEIHLAEKEYSKELLWDLWKSVDLKPIRIYFEDDFAM